MLASLHPLVKLLSATLLFFMILSADRTSQLLPAVAVILIALWFSHSHFPGLVARSRYLLVFFLLVFLWPVLNFGFRQGLRVGALPAVKILLIYTTAYLIAQSMSRWEIATTLQRTLRGFRFMDRLTLLLSLTLGLLPILAGSAGFQYASMCARLGNHRRRRVQHLPLLLGGIIARSLHRAEQMSLALTARYFRGHLGTQRVLPPGTLRRRDLLCAILIVAACGLSICL